MVKGRERGEERRKKEKELGKSDTANDGRKKQ
jgi:hypothetical protein